MQHKDERRSNKLEVVHSMFTHLVMKQTWPNRDEVLVKDIQSS